MNSLKIIIEEISYRMDLQIGFLIEKGTASIFGLTLVSLVIRDINS